MANVDVQIFKYVHTPYGPMSLQGAMAKHEEPQAALDAAAAIIHAAAEARHRAYPRTLETMKRPDHSSMLPVERGDVDRFVILADFESDWAAAKVNNITGALAAGIAAAVRAKGGL